MAQPAPRLSPALAELDRALSLQIVATSDGSDLRAALRMFDAIAPGTLSSAVTHRITVRLREGATPERAAAREAALIREARR